MKCNAHLYLPWPVIAELVAPAAQLPMARSGRSRLPVASVESPRRRMLTVSAHTSSSVGMSGIRSHNTRS